MQISLFPVILMKIIIMNLEKSNTQYDEIVSSCKEEFISKNKKYGNSLEPYTTFDVLSKIFIKLFRVSSIQEAGKYLVEEESIEKEFPGIINYCFYGIMLAGTYPTDPSLTTEKLEEEYNAAAEKVKALFKKKNHDYGEAWRQLPISFMVKECVVKYKRMVNMYSEKKFNVQESGSLRDAFIEVFSDICNYSIFCSILIKEGVNVMI